MRMREKVRMSVNVGKSVFTVAKFGSPTERNWNWRLGSQKLENNGECRNKH